MRLQALKPWVNLDHEGRVEPGQIFEASDYRASELIRGNLAMPATVSTKIKITADPPQKPKQNERKHPGRSGRLA